MGNSSIIIIVSTIFTIGLAGCVLGQPSNITIKINNATSEVKIEFIWQNDTKLNKTELSNYLGSFNQHAGLSSATKGSTTNKLDPKTKSSTPKGHFTSQTISESQNNTHASQNISNTTVNKKSTPTKANTEAVTPDANSSTASSALTKNETSTKSFIAAESIPSTASSNAAKIKNTSKSSVSSNTTMTMSNRTHQSNKTSSGARNKNSVLSGILVTITVVVFLVSGIWIYRKYTSTRFRTTTNNYHLLR